MAVLTIVRSVEAGILTRPDDAPVAMTVFALVDISAELVGRIGFQKVNSVEVSCQQCPSNSHKAVKLHI